MVNTDALIAELEPIFIIKDEVMYLDNLAEIEQVSVDAPLQTDFNAFIFCRQGRLQLELGGSQTVQVSAGKMLLVPARKLVQPMMVSTDVEVGALLVSDRLQKSVLGPQIDIWNRAMYMHETYVVDTERWSEALSSHAKGVFKGEELSLYRELVLSFLRVFLLIICESLLHQMNMDDRYKDSSTDRERMIFTNFLDLLRHERQKRRQVSYYAERLCITPKYLSTVCRNVSNKSPLRWIVDSVMEDCYQQLRDTDLSVKEISNRLGFPNSSFFGQYFREQAGVTPLEYRKKYKNQH